MYKSITLFLLFIVPVCYAQVFNRAYINGNLGYRYHDLGLSVHLFNHFAAAAYSGESTIPTGPIYHESYGIFGNNRLKNRYDVRYVVAGVTTGNWGRACASLMVGSSWINTIQYTNIQIHASQYNQGLEYATYTRTAKKGMGFVVRTDLLVATHHPLFGWNIGALYTINPFQNYLTVHAGLSIGIVENFWDFPHRM